jgi:gluconolactonase
MASPHRSGHSFKTSEFRVVAEGLQYPEGPVYRPDGSVLVVEIGAGQLTSVRPDGSKVVVAQTGGGPNGAAIGPDGAVYICNDGGFAIAKIGHLSVALGYGPNYVGGSIQRVGTDGTVTTLYRECAPKSPGAVPTVPLRSPDDLVFDTSGGFWFTDWGKDRSRDRDITGVYYARPDGSSIKEMIFPLQSPNGIALSPDEKRLYVAESFTRRILYWELSGPGQIQPNAKTLDGSYLLTAHVPYQACLDSMAVDEEGNLYVACFLPHGANPMTRGGITVVSPEGEILEWLEIEIGDPDPLPSNICFGGPDRRTAYITLGGTGRLIACGMRIPGKKLAFG